MVYCCFNHITHKLDYVFKHESRYKMFVHLLITIFPNIASDVKYNAVNITFTIWLSNIAMENHHF